jgi:hypothetical protein
MSSAPTQIHSHAGRSCHQPLVVVVVRMALAHMPVLLPQVQHPKMSRLQRPQLSP